MLKSMILLILAGIIAIILIFATVELLKEKQELAEVCIKGECFKAELAISVKEKRHGLMNREKLGKREGMLFVYEEEKEYSFWMKNVKIPLDIIWIDKDKKIVFMKKNAEPCSEERNCPSIKPDKKAKYIFEVRGGTASELNLSIEDSVEINFN